MDSDNSVDSVDSYNSDNHVDSYNPAGSDNPVDCNNSWWSDYPDGQHQFWPPGVSCWTLGSSAVPIRVVLKGEVLNLYPFLAGDYQLRKTLLLNGQISWRKDSYAGSFAIWSNAAVNEWYIGPLDVNGTNRGTIILPFSNGTEKETGLAEYVSRRSWISPSDPNDIYITDIEVKANINEHMILSI